MPGRKTRKASKSALSVEGLHASFEKLDEKVRRAVASGVTDSELAEVIRRNWSMLFHHGLNRPAVQALVSHYRAVHGSHKKTRKARRGKKQRQIGGAAPLDYVLGQGTTAPVYGRFPVEMGASPAAIRTLDLDRYFDNSIGPSSHRAEAAGPQRGGGLLDSLTMGFSPASVPRNMIETSVSAVQGHTIQNPPADPVSRHAPMTIATLRPFDTSQISSVSSLAPVYTGSV
jgi:hypothetical protein